jgi:hypothetical protein
LESPSGSPQARWAALWICQRNHAITDSEAQPKPNTATSDVMLVEETIGDAIGDEQHNDDRGGELRRPVVADAGAVERWSISSGERVEEEHREDRTRDRHIGVFGRA